MGRDRPPGRPPHGPAGYADPRVVAATRQAIEQESDRSTGTVGRLRCRVEQILAETTEAGERPQMPPERTFYRLAGRLASGRHTFGSARTRRSLANQPAGPFGAVTAARPGEWTQIDSTPLDVRVVHDDGTVDRVELPATFIYAGIDVERRGVFTGTRGRQLAGRCELICTGAFPYRQEWTQLIAALEATLRLHRHEPGTLPAQARYLHQRTGGMIGSLTHLIRGAAIRAILSGQEAITRPLLDSVRIDHAAESATRRTSSTR